MGFSMSFEVVVLVLSPRAVMQAFPYIISPTQTSLVLRPNLHPLSVTRLICFKIYKLNQTFGVGSHINL